MTPLPLMIRSKLEQSFSSSGVGIEGSSNKEERNQFMTLDVKAKVFNLLSNFLLVSLLVIDLLDINVFMS
jgi:hypothetical protein